MSNVWIHLNHPRYGLDIVESEDDLSGQGYRRVFEGMPSWDKAPEWANWLAKDHDGVWYWYEDKPFAYEGTQIWDSGEGKFLQTDPVLYSDWKESLMARPQEV